MLLLWKHYDDYNENDKLFLAMGLISVTHSTSVYPYLDCYKPKLLFVLALINYPRCLVGHLNN